jgi:hypothetical protein
MLTHRIVAYLVGLAVGYWVLTLAEREKNFTRTVGKVIGWIIIVVSFFGPLCLTGSAIYCRTHADNCVYSPECPWNEKGWGGPMMGRDGQCPGHGPGVMNGHCPGMMGDKATPEAKEKAR